MLYGVGNPELVFPDNLESWGREGGLKRGHVYACG